MPGDCISNRLALRLRRQARNGGGGDAQPHHHECHHAMHHHHEEEEDKQLLQVKEQLVRTQAEFDNYRKRQRREQQEQMDQANKNLIQNLIPVLDNFDRALAAPGESVQALLSGIEMVRRQLHDNLKQAGLEPVEAHGQPFDPHVHEAVGTGDPGEVPENHVIEVLQPGYQLKGKLVRPAMVRVARA